MVALTELQNLKLNRMVSVRQCSAVKIDIFRAVLDAFKLSLDGREAIQIYNFFGICTMDKSSGLPRRFRSSQ